MRDRLRAHRLAHHNNSNTVLTNSSSLTQTCDPGTNFPGALWSCSEIPRLIRLLLPRPGVDAFRMSGGGGGGPGGPGAAGIVINAAVRGRRRWFLTSGNSASPRGRGNQRQLVLCKSAEAHTPSQSAKRKYEKAIRNRNRNQQCTEKNHLECIFGFKLTISRWTH